MMAKLLGSPVTESADGNTGGGGSKGQTTFVQADSTCFRDLVQRLTGPPVNDKAQSNAPHKAPKKPATKLHERRKLHARPNIEIASPSTSFRVYHLPPASYTQQVLQSPSPSSLLQGSPRMGIYSHPGGSSNKRVSSEAAGEVLEEKVTKEKRSYMNPSPRSKQRLDLEDNAVCMVSPQPKLLTLFPLTSPTSANAKFP